MVENEAMFGKMRPHFVWVNHTHVKDRVQVKLDIVLGDGLLLWDFNAHLLQTMTIADLVNERDQEMDTL